MPALASFPAILENSVQQALSELLAIQAFLEEKGVRFIVVLIPALQTVDEKVFHQSISYSVYNDNDFDLEKPYKLLNEFCKSKNIELINPLPAFRKHHHKNNSLYLFKDMHFNYAGHKLFAQEILNYLR
jgi:hypothetical protein